MNRLILLTFFAFASFTSNATDLNVPSQYQTIQAALDNSADNDVIRIATGNYNEFLIVRKNVTIIAANNTYLFGTRQPRGGLIATDALINIQASGKVTIKNLWIRGGEKSNAITSKKTGATYMGSATRAIYVKNGHLELDDVKFKSCIKEMIKMDGGQLTANELLFQYDASVDAHPSTIFRLKGLTQVVLTNCPWGGDISDSFITIDDLNDSKTTIIFVNQSAILKTPFVTGKQENYVLKINEGDIIRNSPNQEDNSNEDEGLSNLAPPPVKKQTTSTTENTEQIEDESISTLAPAPIVKTVESNESEMSQFFEINGSTLTSKRGNTFIASYQFKSGVTISNNSQHNGLVAVQYSVNGTNYIGTFNEKTEFIGEFVLGANVNVEVFTVFNNYVSLMYKNEGKTYLSMFDKNMKLLGYQDFTAWPLTSWVIGDEFMIIHYQDAAGNNLIGTYTFDMKFISSYSFAKDKFRLMSYHIDKDIVVAKYKSNNITYVGRFDKNMKFLDETKK